MKRSVRTLGESTLEVTPLGAGAEVGRSCIVLRYRGRAVLLDCGVHPTFSGLSALPFFDALDDAGAGVDAVLVTHYHLDHCAALPYFTERTAFRGRVLMTHPTAAMMRLVLGDYARMGGGGTGTGKGKAEDQQQQLYTEKELERSMARVERVNYRQEVDLGGGLRVTAYNAGHVLGAAMFLVEIAGVRVLYTGDFTLHEDRHLPGADIPPGATGAAPAVDVLIVESTFGVQVLEAREARERRFTGWVQEIVQRGGRCLVPVFALGRAQELLLILDELWEAHPELRNQKKSKKKVPLWYASGLMAKCMPFFQTFINMMNDRIRAQFAVRNPFVFRHAAYVAVDTAEAQAALFGADAGPAVVIASPGMLQSGTSRELFERWCSDPRNGVIIAGYCVEGSFAKALLTGQPATVTTLSGAEVPLRASVHSVSFSAHSDYAQTSAFVDALRPPHIVLVHGERTEMGRLKQALTARYAGTATPTAVMMPSNCQAVQIEFLGESKAARVVGSLAAEAPAPKRRLDGVLVRKNFNYRLVSPGEVGAFTQLKATRVQQRVRVPCHCALDVLAHALGRICGDVTTSEESEAAAAATSSTKKRLLLLVDGGRVVVQLDEQAEQATVEWDGSAVTDMVADGVVAAVLGLEANPTLVAKCQQQMLERRKHSHGDEEDNSDGAAADAWGRLARAAAFVLGRHFGEAAASADGSSVEVSVAENGVVATVRLPSFAVECDADLELREKIQLVATALRDSLCPLLPPPPSSTAAASSTGSESGVGAGAGAVVKSEVEASSSGVDGH